MQLQDILGRLVQSVGVTGLNLPLSKCKLFLEPNLLAARDGLHATDGFPSR